MLAYMSPESLAATRRTGLATFFSRSRGELWTKGDTSGNRLEVVDLRLDCDGDTLLVRARPSGPVCHLGTADCFDQGDADAGEPLFLETLQSIIEQRAEHDDEASYTAALLRSGIPRTARKVGEEALEVVLAATGESGDRLLDEAADLVYHLLVLLRARGLGLRDLDGRLAGRHRPARPPFDRSDAVES
jgi:phosphoribosyl-ATP pyrophosphohydrolase/phosphoribosyl-AMP cyclohydrolase